MRRAILLAALVVLAAATLAQAASIEDIQRANKERGATWTADYNEAWYMHEYYGWYAPTLQLPALTGRENYFVPRKSPLELPTALDWTDYNGVNFVTSPKNQYSCGSCWAFATTGPIESHIAIAENWPDPRIDLSEQQMLSCDNSPGNMGCGGGFTTTSFEYAKSAGLFDEECLPYHASDTWPCDDRCSDWADRLFKIDDWQVVRVVSNPDLILEALQYGPVGTSLTIYEDFYAYSGGIYDTMIAIPQGFHAVTIVGYDATQEYWICKNSWGDDWGEDGYFRIKWGAAAVGIFTIMPLYTSQGLGPEPDDDDVTDDDDDDAVDDDDDDDDDDSGTDDDDDDSGDTYDDDDDADDDDDDDNDSGGCS